MDLDISGSHMAYEGQRRVKKPTFLFHGWREDCEGGKLFLKYSFFLNSLWSQLQQLIIIIFNHVLRFLLLWHQKDRKYLNCVRRNPRNHFVKNGPVIFSIKSLVSKHSKSPWPPLEAQILRTGREKVYSHMLKKFNNRCHTQELG